MGSKGEGGKSRMKKAPGRDVCDGDGGMDMNMNNTFMFVIKMESMDEMEDESRTMNILAAAVKAGWKRRYYIYRHGLCHSRIDAVPFHWRYDEEPSRIGSYVMVE